MQNNEFEKSRNTAWTRLSRDAKNVLEWLEHIYTGEYQTLVIKKDELFIMPGTSILITDEVFQEIEEFCQQDDTIQILYNSDTSLTICYCMKNSLSEM